MKASRMVSAVSRRMLMAVGLAAMVMATSGVALRAQDPAKPAETKPDPLKFDYNGPMILIFQVKPDKSADFEGFWPALRAGLNKSTNADLKAFADTLQPFKVQGVPGLYLFRLEPPSKTFSYDPSKLIYDNINYQKPEDGLFTREEADKLFPKLTESLNMASGAPIQPWKLEKVGSATPMPAVSLSGIR